jgi:chemotaxis protein CheX
VTPIPATDAAISPQSIVEVIESVFSAMLYLPVVQVRDESAVRNCPQLAAHIHIAGAWNGTVLLVCSERFGRRAAAVMLDAAPADVTLGDLHDAVAELANIVGGGIKSLLPGPSTLSLPTVTCGSHFNVHIPRTRQLARLEFTSENEPIQVRLLMAASGH